MFSFPEALVLDLDGSVSLPGEMCRRIDLRRYADRIRYCASFGAMRALESCFANETEGHRLFFLGNGDFHHVSYLLIRSLPVRNLHIVVFDNHPDNMFFPAGIHCGSWVHHAGRLPNVSGISVFGIASGDIAGLNVFQNRLSAVRSGKVRYYCLSRVGAIMRLAGKGNIREIGVDYPGTIEALQEAISACDCPVYLSIDKDVLSSGSIRTTWDQGRMTERELMTCVEMLSPRVIAADVAGDISVPAHLNPLKKILRRLDGDTGNFTFTPTDIDSHNAINLKILSLLAKDNN